MALPEAVLVVLIVLGFWAFAEFLLGDQRPPWGKRLFEWLLVPLLAVILVAILVGAGDPTGLITALIVVGMLALVFAVP
jgi:hypothetical protein